MAAAVSLMQMSFMSESRQLVTACMKGGLRLRLRDAMVSEAMAVFKAAAVS
jgi:hypothetical protein